MGNRHRSLLEEKETSLAQGDLTEWSKSLDESDSRAGEAVDGIHLKPTSHPGVPTDVLTRKKESMAGKWAGESILPNDYSIFSPVDSFFPSTRRRFVIRDTEHVALWLRYWNEWRRRVDLPIPFCDGLWERVPLLLSQCLPHKPAIVIAERRTALKCEYQQTNPLDKHQLLGSIQATNARHRFRSFG